VKYSQEIDAVVSYFLTAKHTLRLFSGISYYCIDYSKLSTCSEQRL